MAKEDVEKNPTELAKEQILEISHDIQLHYLGNAEDAIATMAQPIINAETFEEMFLLGPGAEPDKELFNVGLNIQEISFNRSGYEEGLPFYATFKGKRTDNGVEFVTNCGAWQVVLIAYKLVKNGWLPRTMQFHKSETPTSRGFYPVNLLPFDAF